MSATQPSSEAPDPAAARTERHLRLLAELAEIGMDLAREVRRQALDQSEDSPPAADLALTFSRIARAVRQTVALEARLAEPPRPGHAERASLTVSDRWRSARRKRQVGEIVEGVIESDAAGEFDSYDLLVDLHERLEDGYDEEADFADRPIGELVARICGDLGVEPDWSLLKDEDWAIAAKSASTPGEAERGEGRERGDAGFAPISPGPAMTHPPPWPTSGH
jgi:hypothetical protein